MAEQGTPDSSIIELTADVISAYVANNSVPPGELPGLIAQIHASLTGLTSEKLAAPVEELKPAVPVKKSITPDYIVCLEDGRRFKSLKRHLYVRYGLSPAEYRAKWGLPSDYPMAAPNYAAARSDLAKTIGLGRKANQEPAPAATAVPSGAKRGRSQKAAAPKAKAA